MRAIRKPLGMDDLRVIPILVVFGPCVSDVITEGIHLLSLWSEQGPNGSLVELKLELQQVIGAQSSMIASQCSYVVCTRVRGKKHLIQVAILPSTGMIWLIACLQSDLHGTACQSPMSAWWAWGTWQTHLHDSAMVSIRVIQVDTVAHDLHFGRWWWWRRQSVPCVGFDQQIVATSGWALLFKIKVSTGPVLAGLLQSQTQPLDECSTSIGSSLSQVLLLDRLIDGRDSMLLKHPCGWRSPCWGNTSLLNSPNLCREV